MITKNISLDALNISPIQFTYVNQNRDWFEDAGEDYDPLTDSLQVTEGALDVRIFEGSLNILVEPTQKFGNSEFTQYVEYPNKSCGVDLCFGDSQECVEAFLGGTVDRSLVSSFWITAPLGDCKSEMNFNLIPLKDDLVSEDKRFCHLKFREYTSFNSEGLGVIFNNTLEHHNFKESEYVLELQSDFVETPISQLTCHDFSKGNCPENSTSIFWMNGDEQICSWLNEDNVWMDRIYGGGVHTGGSLDSVLFEDVESNLILKPDGYYLISKPSNYYNNSGESGVDNSSDLLFSSGCVDSGILVDVSSNEIEVNYRK